MVTTKPQGSIVSLREIFVQKHNLANGSNNIATLVEVYTGTTQVVPFLLLTNDKSGPTSFNDRFKEC
jgi:hypothetical protein